MRQHVSICKTGFWVIVLVAAMGVAGCSSHWPAFRHDGLRTGGQLRSGPLSDSTKVQNLAIGWTFPASAGVPMNPPLIAFRASPVIYKKTVYIGNGNGFFYAINAIDGTLRWRYPKSGPPLDQTFHSNPSSNGIASSATIATINGVDAVIFGAPDVSIGTGLGSGRLFALNAQTGDEIWKSPEIAALRSDGVTHEQIGYSSPLVFNEHVYIGVGDHGDNPIQRGKVVAVSLSNGQIDNGFGVSGSFYSTGLPRGGGVWGSVAGWPNGVYVTTGNSNIGGPEPSPDNALSMLRLDPNSGSIIWGWKPVPYDLDGDPDWSATPSIMLSSCGTLALSTEKDGWTWALNTGNGTPGPPSVRWAFPPGPWSTSGFHSGDGTTHGDTRYLRPGAVWDDVYIVQTGGLTVTQDVHEGFQHLYALNACASDAQRVRWIKDVPNSSHNCAYGWPPNQVISGCQYSLGPPTVSRGIVYVGTDQGHLVAIGDPTVVPPDGMRCTYPLLPNIICQIFHLPMVPDPHVIKDVNLNAGPINTEPALLRNGRVYVSTDGGQVVMLKP
jgi:outer membrane protein assembly factor BamB